jgi:hypothetical protein
MSARGFTSTGKMSEPTVPKKPTNAVARGLGLYFVALGFSLTVPMPPHESWLLQAVRRLMNGEVLYRDVFCGVTPLSVYITWFLSRIFGLDLLLERMIVQACFVASVFLVLRICRQLGMTSRFPWLLVVTLLVYGQNRVSTPYSPLALPLLLGCFSLTLTWVNRQTLEDSMCPGASRTWVGLGLAGLCAGLCFGSKQNAGIYVLAALLATVPAVSLSLRMEMKRFLEFEGVVLTSFLLACTLVILPVFLTGGLPRLLDYGFLGKGAYLHRAGGMQSFTFESPSALLSAPGELTTWQGIYIDTAYVAPALAVFLLLLAWLRSKRNKQIVTFVVAAFTVAGMLLAYPVPDQARMNLIFPALVPALVHGWRKGGLTVPHGVTQACRVAAWAWLSLALGFHVLRPAVGFARGRYAVASLPYHHGILMESTQLADYKSRIQTLRQLTGGARLFILSHEASFYYLALGIPDPTPYDIPAVTAFGRHGQQEVITAIQQGRISQVCWEHESFGTLNPEVLEKFITTNMVRGQDAGPCTLYALPKGARIVNPN